MKMSMFAILFVGLSAHATPYDTLKSLYDSATVPAQKTDFTPFGTKSSMQCASASEGAVIADVADAMKFCKSLKPSQGPLFPASERDLLVPESQDKVSSRYDSDSELKDMADNLKLTQTPTDLVVEGQMWLATSWKTARMSFRKSGAYIVEKSELDSVTTYIYCWR